MIFIELLNTTDEKWKTKNYMVKSIKYICYCVNILTLHRQDVACLSCIQ